MGYAGYGESYAAEVISRVRGFDFAQSQVADVKQDV
jgi:hypothetical protein